MLKIRYEASFSYFCKWATLKFHFFGILYNSLKMKATYLRSCQYKFGYWKW